MSIFIENTRRKIRKLRVQINSTITIYCAKVWKYTQKSMFSLKGPANVVFSSGFVATTRVRNFIEIIPYVTLRALLHKNASIAKETGENTTYRLQLRIVTRRPPIFVGNKFTDQGGTVILRSALRTAESRQLNWELFLCKLSGDLGRKVGMNANMEVF